MKQWTQPEPINQLARGCRSLGLQLSRRQKDLFIRYLNELLDWNARINLISKRDESRIVPRHFLESVILLSVVGIENGARVLDVGSGAGFPGLPLKICRPDLNLTLVDSIRKKVLFLRRMIDVLGLEGVRAIWSRVENLTEAGYDVVVSRTAMRLGQLVMATHSRLVEGGRIITFLGSDRARNVEEVRRKLSERGCNLTIVRETIRVPVLEEDRILLVMSVARAPYFGNNPLKTALLGDRHH